ncbi:hypothetical protein [Sphingomonas sp.]|uniref:hypothetical protein n=1 Tax=Sphingomonas sp. TaxID=28214 RepID=UPI003B00CA1E
MCGKIVADLFGLGFVERLAVVAEFAAAQSEDAQDQCPTASRVQRHLADTVTQRRPKPVVLAKPFQRRAGGSALVVEGTADDQCGAKCLVSLADEMRQRNEVAPNGYCRQRDEGIGHRGLCAGEAVLALPAPSVDALGRLDEQRGGQERDGRGRRFVGRYRVHAVGVARSG